MPFSPKRPSEREYFGFRYTRLLPDGVTVVSALWSAAVVEGTDAAPSAMISGSAAVDDDLVSQLIIDGEEDVQYCLSCAALLSDGQVKVLCDTVWVRAVCDG